MSPPPPTDPDFARAADDFKRGGWIVALLGGSGIVARMLLANEHHPIMFWIKKAIAGSIVGTIAYFIFHGVEMTGLHKSILMSVAGAGSPEIIEWIKHKFTKKIDEEETKASRNYRGRK